MKRLWLLSRLSSNRSTCLKHACSTILPIDVQSEFPYYDLDFLLKNFLWSRFAVLRCQQRIIEELLCTSVRAGICKL